MTKCIYPRCKCKPTRHHFPVSKLQGGTITVPLCRFHHNKAEEGDPKVLDVLIREAPFYWMSMNNWDEVRDSFFIWLKEYRNGECISIQDTDHPGEEGIQGLGQKQLYAT